MRREQVVFSELPAVDLNIHVLFRQSRFWKFCYLGSTRTTLEAEVLLGFVETDLPGVCSDLQLEATQARLW